MSALFSRRCLLAALLLFGFSAGPPGTLLAGGGPENVVVVVNADSWASKAVANEFIALRDIPPGNVIYLENLPDILQLDVEIFRKRILLPVLQEIDKRGLAGQIDYVVYSSDLPYAISVGPDLIGQKLPKVITPVASINGLTFLYRLVLAKNPAYLSLQANRYYRQRLPVISAQLSREDREELAEAAKFIQDEKWEEAAEHFESLLKQHPRIASWRYNLACCLARLDKSEDALAELGRAVEHGWFDSEHAQADKDLASLREKPKFKELLERMRNTAFEMQPPLGFRATREFDPKGEVVAGTGHRYLLSTMLAMTSGRGNSVDEAIQSLRRSAEADGTRPKGTIYFLKNGDIRSRARHSLFPYAVRRLKELGVAAEVIEGTLPSQKEDVRGLMVGRAGFDWPGSKSQIQPGAICEHLTSFGGVLRERAGQTPLTEFIRHGAAGASGTVTEPYAILAKFPHPFIHARYVRGCSLAEAYYQSVHGPYQLLVVGDPLCQPWAETPQVAVDGIQPGATLQDTVRISPKTTGSAKASHFELFVDGLRRGECQPGKSFEFDTRQLPDGHHEFRIVAVAEGPVETQGRAIVPVQIANRGQTLHVNGLQQETLRWDQPLKLSARLKGGKRIAFLHNGRVVASITGSEGEAALDLKQLGQGPVRLQPIGLLEEGLARVTGEPLTFSVMPPQPLPALNVNWNELKPGLAVRAGGKTAAVEDTQKHDWLSQAGVSPEQPFTVTGYFQVPEEGVYQFQVRTKMPVSLSVDARQFDLQEGDGWRFLPVALAKGTHQVKIAGTAAEPLRLQVLFGGPGAKSLNKDRFRQP